MTKRERTKVIGPRRGPAVGVDPAARSPHPGPDPLPQGRAWRGAVPAPRVDDCVEVLCPVDDEDVGEHAATICRRGSDCENVAISCAEGHRSSEVLEAILSLLQRDQD